MIVREFIAMFGIKTDEKGLQEADSRIKQFSQSVTNSLKAIGLVYAGIRAARLIKSQIDVAAQLKNTSEALGIGVEQLQKLGFAAEQSGLSQEDFQFALGRLNLMIGKAANGSEVAQRALAGIDWQGVAKGTIDGGEAFLQLAESISKIENPVVRTRKAQEIFGVSFRKILLLLGQGREGFKKLGDQFAKTGAMFTQEQVDKANKFNNSLNLLKYSLKGLVTAFFDATLGQDDSIDKITDWVQSIQKAVKNSEIVKATLVGLGIAILFFQSGIVLTVAAVALFVLILDDLFTLFSGGDSAIGRFIDSLFGVGESAKLVEYLKFKWEELLKAIRDPSAFKALKGIAKLVFGIVGLAILGAIGLAEMLITALTGVVKFAGWVADKFESIYGWMVKIGLLKPPGLKQPVGVLQQPTAPISSPFIPINPITPPAIARLSEGELLHQAAGPNMFLPGAGRAPSVSFTDAANISVTVNATGKLDERAVARIVVEEVNRAKNNNNTATMQDLLKFGKPVGAM